MSEGSFSQLVVIGSSAGGVEALSKLVSTLPEDFPAPIVLAQHLDPERESHLKEILSRRSTLPVKTITDKAPLEPGVVFVVPADRHVNVTDSEVGLQVDSAGRPKPSVDLLLSSAAEVYKERLIAVVLTGMGTDGADGARLVNKAGGTVVVQDPKDAAFPGMPGSLAPNVVDISADLESIGPILGSLVSRVEVAEGTPSEDEEEALARFLEELRDRHGVDFRSYKMPTILRRLKRRLAATGSADIEEYRGYLEEHPEEYRQLVSSFLIKVTEFFRDPELFEYLKEEVLPNLIEEAREDGRPLRIWSAGCATGEEAYSLAILLSEVLGEEALFFDVRIFATDVDEEAISFARQGVYPESSLGGLSGEQIRRYFAEEDGQYQVRKAVRSMLVFGEHDLARRSPFPRIDLCVSRNVLIYFTLELQRRALQLFAYSLRDGGALVLGKAETTAPLSDYFEPANRQYKVYRRQGERFLMPPLPAAPTPMPKRTSTHHGAVSEALLVPGVGGATGEADPQQLEAQQQRVRTADEGLLNRLPVGAVVVDRRYDIRAINAPARRLLSIHGGVVGEDFLHTLKEAPYAEVRSAIDAAFRDGGSASTDEFAVEEATGERRYLRLDCYPQRAAGEAGLAETVMVVVHDVTRSAAARRDLEERLATATGELARTRREAEADTTRLEQQNTRLLETNRNLEEAIQELTNLSEDLQQAYEGALLTAEESQAAVEEVETLNEELQATNEELETLNEELQATIEELNTTNDDLQARTAELQDSTRGREEDRQQSEAAQQDLRRRAEEPEAILWSLLNDVAVLAVDADGKVLFGNKAFEETFGAPKEAVANPSGLLYAALLDEAGEGLPEDTTPLSQATRGETFTMRFAVEDGGAARRLFEAEGHPLNPAGDGGGVVVFREVPEETPAEG